MLSGLVTVAIDGDEAIDDAVSVESVDVVLERRSWSMGKM